LRLARPRAGLRQKASNLGARLELQWRTNKGKISTVVVGADVTGTTDWVERSKLVVAPKNAVKARLNLFLAKETDDAGHAWFDELSLVLSDLARTVSRQPRSMMKNPPMPASLVTQCCRVVPFCYLDRKR